jgi:hypothetical protein
VSLNVWLVAISLMFDRIVSQRCTRAQSTTEGKDMTRARQ